MKCWASAAEPPLPHARILPLLARAAKSRSTAAARGRPARPRFVRRAPSHRESATSCERSYPWRALSHAPALRILPAAPCAGACSASQKAPRSQCGRPASKATTSKRTGGGAPGQWRRSSTGSSKAAARARRPCLTRRCWLPRRRSRRGRAPALRPVPVLRRRAWRGRFRRRGSAGCASAAAGPALPASAGRRFRKPVRGAAWASRRRGRRGLRAARPAGGDAGSAGPGRRGRKARRVAVSVMAVVARGGAGLHWHSFHRRSTMQ